MKANRVKEGLTCELEQCGWRVLHVLTRLALLKR